MTKKVRIENADSAPYKMVVQIWDKGFPEGTPDKMALETVLANPCDMMGAAGELYITSSRYIVIKETQ